MKTKWLKIMLVIMSIALLIGMVACSDRANDDLSGEDSGISEPNEKDAIFTVAIYNDTLYNVNYYLAGQTIVLTSKQVLGKQFVRWEIDGETLSYQEQTTYTVEKSAVIKAIYTTTSVVEVQDLVDGVFTVNFEEDKSVESGTLYQGYHFTVPAPTKKYYTFVGYYTENGTKVTDAKGKSIIAYDGSFTTLVPQFKENDFVNIVIVNDETDERVEKKWYVEDGEYEATAGSVVDRQCIGWVDASGKEVASGTNLTIGMNGLTAGETYEYTAIYREAYKLMVISGYGSGAYAKEDSVSLSCTAPVGKEFLYWEIVDGDVSYTLGVKVDGEKEYLGLIDGETFTYYDGEQKVTQENLDGVEKLGKKYNFLMGDLENIGVQIMGKQTVISAVFNRVIFYLTYKLNHVVDGVSALDQSTIEVLEGMGFVDNDGILEKTVGYEYNDAISLINIPEVDNYSFERWQSATGAAIPTTMPQNDIELVGTFKANKYNVTVVSPANGTVKIGSGGNTTSGYYSYNSTIKIYVTADLGYEFDRWRNIEDMEITLVELEREEGEIISYVFEYVVKEKQRFTVDFDTREYTIFYSTSTYYDGKEVTNDANYFENYQENYNQFTEKVKFGNVNTALQAQPTTSSMGLIYADYWNVGDWVITDKDGNVDMNINASDFVMPSYNLYAHCKYEIKNYRMSLSGNEGVERYSIRTINGKEAVEYLTDSENLTYTVPYGSDVLADVKYNVGYDKGEIRSEEIIIDGENSFLDVQEIERYNYEIAFKMLLSKGNGNNYALYSIRNLHTLSYYVNVDYDNVDPELNLYDYLGVDAGDTVEHNGKVYSRLLTATDGEVTELTVTDYVYDQKINLFAFNESIIANNRYKFKNWNKVYEGNAYGGANMPDGDVYVYGDMVLDTFTLSIGTGKFDFDGDPTANVKTAYENGFTQDGQDEEFNDGGEYRYYSAIVLEPENPTGYDFVAWQVSTRAQSGAITNTVLSLEGEGLQKQDGYYYENNADGSLTVYLTKNVTVSATFKKKTFSLSIGRNEVMVQKEGTIGEYYTASDKDVKLEYGTYLTLVLNRSRILDGYKVSNINIENTDGDALSVVDVPLDTEYYYYEQEEFKPTDYYVKEDVVINPIVEKIKYTMTYVVYSALNDVTQLRNDTAYNTITDVSYVIELNEEKVLMREDELNEKLAEQGVSTENLMYSGWFSEISVDASEGEGFIQDRQYTSSKSYKHSVKDANAIFYCYLIEMYDYKVSGNGVEISVNDVIKNTPAYNSYFTEARRQLELPSKNKEQKSVVAVADFAKMVGIEEVTIPTDVATIKESAFSECAGLTTVNYNENLTVIGKKAFYGCIKLTSNATTNLPELITTIGESAFDGCESIEEIVLTNRVSTIQDKAFANIPNLREVVIDGQYLTFESAIGNGIFSLSGANVEGGFDVMIGSQTTYVHANFFRSDANADYGRYLGDVIVEEGVKTIEIGGNAFRNSGIRSISFNERITKITEYAFFGCKNLESVDLSATLITLIEPSLFRQSSIKEVIMPVGITGVGAYAFAGCDKMESLYYTAKTDGTYAITEISMGAFQYENSGAKTSIVRFVDAELRDSVLSDSGVHKVIDIPEGTAKIMDNAFHSCDKIEALVIPSTITTIGSNAFYSSTALKDIVYNATSAADLISGEPFGGAGAEGLTLTIGDNVTKIPAHAFNGMAKLVSLTLPEGLQTIGNSAFANITRLAEVNYKAISLDDVEGSVFAGSGSATGMVVNVYSSVEEMPAYLFYGAGKVGAVNVLADGERNLLIRKNAFNGISGISELIFTEMAELTIETEAFKNAQIQKIAFSDQIAKITIQYGGLSDNEFYDDMSIVYAGTEINKATAYLTAGTLISTKNANSGYDSEIINGMLSVAKDLLINDNNTLSLSSSEAYVNMGELRVAGEITVDANSELQRTEGQGLIVAIPRDETNLNEKVLDDIAYDVLEIERDITVDGSATVEFNELKIMSDATLSINGEVDAVANNRFHLEGKIIVSGALSLVCEYEKYGNGVIEANSSANALVEIDDSAVKEKKTYVDNVNGTALSVSAGKVSIYPQTKEFVIESGATVTTDSAFSWDENEILTLNGMLINNASAYVSRFVMGSNAWLTVNARFAIYDKEDKTDWNYPQIGDESKIKSGVYRAATAVGGVDGVYYKDFTQAFADDVGDATGVVLEVREDITTSESVETSYDAEIKLNGKTYTYSGNNEAFAVAKALVISNGTLSVENGTAFVVVDEVAIESDGLVIRANNAYVVGGGITVVISDTEISATQKGISVEDADSNLTFVDTTIRATVGIESVEKTTISVTRSTVEATDYALLLSAGRFVNEDIPYSTVQVEDTNLSSLGAQATQDSPKATVYVGHVAKVTVTNTHGELLTNENGTTVLVDNRFIPDKSNDAFIQSGGSTEGKVDYDVYVEKIKDLFVVNVTQGNVVGEIAEIVRGEYADQYANRIKVKDNDVVGLVLTEWSETNVNHARYVKGANADTEMSASSETSPYVATGETVTINVVIAENNLVVANNANKVIINSAEIWGTLLAKIITTLEIAKTTTIKSGAEIATNKAPGYQTQLVVNSGVTMILEASDLPINSFNNSGVLQLKATLEGLESVHVSGATYVDSGVSLQAETITLTGNSSLVNEGTVVANNVTSSGSITTLGSLTVNEKLTTSGTYSQSAPVTAGEIESTGTFTIDADNATLTVGGNLSIAKTFDAVANVSVGGTFTMNAEYTLTIRKAFSAESIVNKGMMEVLDGATIDVTKSLTNMKTISNAGEITVGNEVVNEGTYSESGALTAQKFTNADTNASATVSIYASGSMEIGLSSGGEFSNRGVIEVSGVLVIGKDYSNNSNGSSTASLTVYAGGSFGVAGDLYNLGENSAIVLKDRATLSGTIYNTGAITVEASNSVAGIENEGDINITGDGTTLTLTSGEKYTLNGKLTVGANAKLKASAQNKVEFTSGALLLAYGTIENLDIYLQSNVVVVDTADLLTLYDSASIDGTAVELIEGDGYVLADIQQEGESTGNFAKYTHVCSVNVIAPTCGTDGYSECTVEAISVAIDAPWGVYAVYSHDEHFDITLATGEHSYSGDFTWSDFEDENGSGTYRVIFTSSGCSNCNVVGGGAIVVLNGGMAEAEALASLAGLEHVADTQTSTSGSGMSKKTTTVDKTYTITFVGDGSGTTLAEMATKVTVSGDEYKVVKVMVTIMTTTVVKNYWGQEESNETEESEEEMCIVIIPTTPDEEI